MRSAGIGDEETARLYDMAAEAAVAQLGGGQEQSAPQPQPQPANGHGRGEAIPQQARSQRGL